MPGRGGGGLALNDHTDLRWSAAAGSSQAADTQILDDKGIREA
jgi:hypothetical protein